MVSWLGATQASGWQVRYSWKAHTCYIFYLRLWVTWYLGLTLYIVLKSTLRWQLSRNFSGSNAICRSELCARAAIDECIHGEHYCLKATSRICFLLQFGRRLWVWSSEPRSRANRSQMVWNSCWLCQPLTCHSLTFATNACLHTQTLYGCWGMQGRCKRANLLVMMGSSSHWNWGSIFGGLTNYKSHA